MRRTLLFLLAAAACSEPAAEPTPGEVYASFYGAYEAGRYAEMLAHVDPDDHRLLTLIFLQGAGFLTAKSDGISDAFDALCVKNGIPLDPEATEKFGRLEGNDEESYRKMADKVFAETDLPPLFADLLAFLAEHNPDQKLFKPSLSEVEVTGDVARGKAGGEPLEFVRRDGRWYLDVAMK